MRKSILGVAALLATAITLAACSSGDPGDGTPFPPEPEATELGMNIGEAPVHEGRLAGGETDYFRFTAPAGVDEMMVIELDADLQLDVTNGVAGTTIVTSSSNEYFAPAVSPFGGAQVAPQAIVTTAPCRGSCIVIGGAPGTFYFDVTNEGGAAVDYAVYLYDTVATDTSEPNDSRELATAYELGTENEGAIETLFDTDWWVVEAGDASDGFVLFAATGGIDIEAYRVSAGGVESGPFASGSEIAVSAGDSLRVESGTDRAARGANGYYYLSPPDPIVVPLND